MTNKRPASGCSILEWSRSDGSNELNDHPICLKICVHEIEAGRSSKVECMNHKASNQSWSDASDLLSSCSILPGRPAKALVVDYTDGGIFTVVLRKKEDGRQQILQ